VPRLATAATLGMAVATVPERQKSGGGDGLGKPATRVTLVPVWWWRALRSSYRK